MLNNPIVLWSLFAICLQIVNYVDNRKSIAQYRASDSNYDDSPVPRSIRIIQFASILCPLILLCLSGLSSVAWLGNFILFPVIPMLSKFWQLIILIAGVVSIVKVTKYLTISAISELLSKKFEAEALQKIADECQKKIYENTHAIIADQIAGFYQSTNFHKWKDEEEKTLVIIKEILSNKK